MTSTTTTSTDRSNQILGVTPCGFPSASLCAAVSGAGALGVLDLGQGARVAREALLSAASAARANGIGIRVPAECVLTWDDVVDLLTGEEERIELVVLGWNSPWQISEIPDRYLVLVEVATWQEAAVAAQSGADGVIARGNEAGGRVGDQSSFVLLQQLLGAHRCPVPVWVAGGIGPHTAAAAIAGGAAGVVLDTQLALLAESDLPDTIRRAIAASDGTDTEVIDGARVLPARGNDATALPVGQDTFLATRYAARYGGVARLVRAVCDSIRDAMRGDYTPPISGDSALAGQLGCELPVVQGPMTRVSDQAGFARAVAEQGALPFLALALASPEQSRAMLIAAKDAIGDRPWGVGILGFAPEELRTAQLEVITELRPASVLIAGGRPDQALALEDEGIATFLHVPSPGLLEQYLTAGARRFVFEGAECGGHVGPRTSFSLWEAQIGVLLDYLDAHAEQCAADQVQVLFAGGIHDARSSAMVSALAEPLARRGTAIGILMGTGYLFTEEAVRHGAVQPLFQRQVLNAARTTLLHTAPGHATRCVESTFTERFLATAEELNDRCDDPRAVWEQLEQLNVGRLRIASKGLRRVGERLLPASEAEQAELGLFMAGDVATLRSETTTIAGLHAAVTTAAAEFYAARSAAVRTEAGRSATVVTEPDPVDIAIVGMSCVYPGATDLTEFWANIVGNVDSVTEVPAQRWDPALYYADPATKDSAPAGDWTPSKWGGFIPEIGFDPLRYGIPPSALAAIEPVQLIALQIADAALADAGYDRRPFDRSATGVVFAGAVGSDLGNAKTLRMVLPSYIGELPPELDAQLPKLTEDTLPGRLGSVIAGRIANRLDLGGMNYTIDAACASSLAAVDAACKELVSGSADMMLCGGADLHNAIEDFLLFASVGALSPTGSCKAFDSSGDGIALSEGVSCVVLKRLADAEADGDRVYAVIKGVGGGSDGKALGLTAPRPDGQRRALERAYRSAGISPAEVGLLEAHGTGTVVGDRTELETLTSVFRDAGAQPGSCALGSVKSQIGHTKCAAGLAGLIKLALAVHTGVKPPTLHLREPNSAWRAGESPFQFHTGATPWTQRPEQRVAGVSAFGFGGTNFHVVLTGHASAETTRSGLDHWPAELFVFHGADEDVARRHIERLLAIAKSNEAHGRPWSMRDLARTAAVRADPDVAPAQVALVARDHDELIDLLTAAVAGRGDPARGLFTAGSSPSAREPGGTVALLFPGQGSQRPGMLAELFVAFPELQRFARGQDDVSTVMFPASAFGDGAVDAQQRAIRDTRMAQPALGIAGLAAHHVLSAVGVTGDCYAGHSYGELVALAAAGAIDTATLLRLSRERANAILAAAGEDPGGMAAVAAAPDEVAKVVADAGLSEQVVIANHNAPRQVVISGPSDGLEAALGALREARLPGTKLNVACAFHSPVVAQAGERFAAVLNDVTVRPPERPVWTNRTATRYPADAERVRTELAAALGASVRFADQIEAMYADGVRIFVEAGPGSVLSGLVRKILGDRPHTVTGVEAGGTGGLAGFLRCLAELAVAGAGVRPAGLFAGRDARDVTSAIPPARPGWTVNGHLVRTADGQPLPGGLAPAQRIEDAMMTQSPTSRPGPPESVEALVADFLASSRELIAAQRDVMLSYFGAPVESPTPGHYVDAVPSSNVASAVPSAAEEPSPAQASPEPTVPTSRADVLASVVDVIAQRTGYPVEMIGPDLDLEADLSVDSIKRTEIAGELAARLGIAGEADRMEALTRSRTAGAMADVVTRSAQDTAPVSPAPPSKQTASASVAPTRSAAPVVGAALEAPTRYVPKLVEGGEAELGEPTALVGAVIMVAGGGSDLAEDVAGQLSAHGAVPVLLRNVHELGDDIHHVDGLISLHALDPDADPVLPSTYPLFRSALRRDPRWVLVAAPAADPAPPAAHGLRGFIRTLHREYPDTAVRLLELDNANEQDTTAAAIVSELLTTSDEPVITLLEGTRYCPRMIASSLGTLARTGAGPAGTGQAEAAALGLSSDSVVLLVGGARGITAQAATALASASSCRIELAGRTQQATEPEPEKLRGATDLPALRAALAGLGQHSPAEIDQMARRILARREVEATLRELRGCGSEAGYRSVDARDAESIRQLVKQVYTEHGRLDGVVYAAGVIEDRLVADKDAESFTRVYSTKVDGAQALLDELGELPVEPRFTVLFGSIAAVLGNRGQADYAAANDALAALAAHRAARTAGRVVTVHWGPWAPHPDHGGMVSAELSRNYAERGISLIEPADGVACLLRELAWGPDDANSVIYTASGW